VVAIAHGRGDQAAGGGRAGGGVAAQFVVGVDGLALFVAGSPVAGLASATGPPVAARTVQGIGAALAVPATLALIGTMYPPGRARTRALGVLAAMTSAGVISGVLLGGLVTEVAGWRWVFLMVVPPALAAALAAPRVLPEGRAEGAAGPPDLAGGLLGPAAVMLLVYALTRLEAPGRGLVSAALSGVAGPLLLAGFVAWERRAPAPLLRPGILSIRSLRGATLGAAANSGSFTAVVFVGTLYLQTGLGYPPLQAGLAVLPLDLVAAVVGFTAGRLLAGRSPRAAAVAAFLASAAAMGWLARAPVPASYATDVLPALLVFGVSAAVGFVILTGQAVADVGPDEQGLASGVFETANHLGGGAAAVALYATVIALVAGEGAAGPEALARGYGAAFLAAAGLAVLGAAGGWQLHGQGGWPTDRGG